MNSRNTALRSRLTAAVALTTALAGVVAAAPGAAATARSAPTTSAPRQAAGPGADAEAPGSRGARKPLTQRQLQRAVERTLREAGYVNISVELRDGRRHIGARAGEAKLNTGRPVPRGASFRAGSVTKTFVATVIMQLVAEGQLALDDTVEEWLPGLVAGKGNDGRRITIKNLLQHTSGLHNYDITEDIGETAADFERTRFLHIEPRRLIAGAVKHEPDFPAADPNDPAPKWKYNNPGYVLLGMIIEKATGHPWGEEVKRRITKPLKLKGTYAPGDDPYLRGPHAHTYHVFPGSKGWTDTTTRNMTWGDAAGAMVTTERDVNRFYTQLLTGRLLPAAQLKQMRAVVPVSEEFDEVMPDLQYGLGLMRQPLTCGGVRWGHGGDIDGGVVRTGFTADGKRGVVIAASGKKVDYDHLIKAERAFQGLVNQALCGPDTR
ncbi:serine hydrolase domain-containing protein [Streptomyces zagrosensis]|uniref:D-alanyl-D-alanine carboxypeptidase n=1 Tax=Streptomyces zagrosensis TaxID=1042984 RepID=A0A7W9QCY7_9ACTN|nr:serine hydrolase domain-containing protein [Streptomyces zagrosensis]MBB5937975.1 D-alanyl-D-alanine carboxypeptidase [Streptomyces zagrosensis]